MIGRLLLHHQAVERLGEDGMVERVADPGRKRRFVQEVKAASALNHPNINNVYDIGSADGVDFMAMEHVAGKTLTDLIPRRGMRLSEAFDEASHTPRRACSSVSGRRACCCWRCAWRSTAGGARAGAGPVPWAG